MAVNVAELREQFETLFGSGGKVKAYFAPGRVNLIGEHTDYNGGHVFPCALTIGTYGIIRPRSDRRLRLYSVNFSDMGIVESSLDDLVPSDEAGWTNYPKGIMWTFEKRGYHLTSGADLLFYGDIPAGSGLSSSASLEVLTGLMLRDTFGFEISMVDLALIGQYSENNFNGMNCGIMDQFASVFGKKDCLIRLDCRSLEFEYFPFRIDGHKLVLVDSVVKHELVDSPYNKRRQSCERVAKRLGIETLRDADMEALDAVKGDISAEDYMRAKFVIGEKQRVLDVCDALGRGDLATVGRCMYETHEGLSKDYEVSCEELDYLNDIAKECGVTGSRIMGGGFGGCTINLVADDKYDHFIATAKEKFAAKYGHEPKIYDVIISDGARRL